MPTLQVRAWEATRNGSIEEASHLFSHSLADAALAEMMLRRRRTAAAQVVGTFLEIVGNRFQPYLESRIPDPPVDPQREMAAARTAGEIVERLCDSAPPLLFERALLADVEGRQANAAADLDRLLEAYPGFLSAAVMAARLANQAGAPMRAIRTLAIVERELLATREGVAVLADSLHGIGNHMAASRYELAMLAMLSGEADPRANQCAPVDLAGRVTTHPSMPKPIAIEIRPNGILFNDRGLYYIADLPVDGRARLASGRLSPVAMDGAGLARIAEILSSILPIRLRLFLFTRKQRWRLRRKGPAPAPRELPQTSVTGAAPVKGPLQTGRTAARKRSTLLKGLYRGYKHLPLPIRFFVNKYGGVGLFRNLMTRRLDFQAFDSVQHRMLVQERLQAGVSQIFQSPPNGERECATTETLPDTDDFSSLAEQILGDLGKHPGMESDEISSLLVVADSPGPAKER